MAFMECDSMADTVTMTGWWDLVHSYDPPERSTVLLPLNPQEAGGPKDEDILSKVAQFMTRRTETRTNPLHAFNPLHNLRDRNTVLQDRELGAN